MNDDLLSSLLDSEDVGNLNRLAAINKINTKDIISNSREIPPTLYTRSSNIHGIGVFSSTPIKVGQLIESVYIIPLDFSSKYHKDDTIINYCYALPSDNDEHIKKHGYELFMFTGFGMIYNHQNTSLCNAKWFWDLDNKSAKLLAVKNIINDQEITIDYGYGYWNRQK